MAFIETNLEEVESSFKPHRPGLAHLRIEDMEMRPNKKQTAYYMNTRIKVLSVNNEPPVDDEGKPNESPVWHKYSLQPQALFGLANLFKAIGKTYKLAWDPENANDRNRVEMELRELLTGAEFVDVLKTEVYTPDDGSDPQIKTALSGKYKKAY